MLKTEEIITIIVVAVASGFSLQVAAASGTELGWVAALSWKMIVIKIIK
jgi:hypothetical protein